MSETTVYPDAGYYVVPCYLFIPKYHNLAHPIWLHIREYTWMFGEIREYEPQDVKMADWFKSSTFKDYSWIYGTNYKRDGIKLDECEFYDNADEAVERAKELDIRMKYSKKWAAAVHTLNNHKRAKEKLELKIFKLKMQSKSELRNIRIREAEILIEKRNKQIAKKKIEYDKYYSVISPIKLYMK